MDEYSVLAARLESAADTNSHSTLTAVPSLVTEFKRLQGVRIQTYRSFDAALKELIASNCVNKYSDYCSHYTSIFTDISAAVRDVRDKLQSMSVVLAKLITQVQELERTKLQLTALHHMSILQRHGGVCFSEQIEVSPEEYQTSLHALGDQINEEMDNVQSGLISGE
jgi:hypothetical protein